MFSPQFQMAEEAYRRDVVVVVRMVHGSSGALLEFRMDQYSTTEINVFPDCIDVPDNYRERVAAAFRFLAGTRYTKMEITRYLRGSASPLSQSNAREFSGLMRACGLTSALCWAGLEGARRPKWKNEDKVLVKIFNDMVLAPMTEAIGEVFPEEGFAELVMSFCPRPCVYQWGEEPR